MPQYVPALLSLIGLVLTAWGAWMAARAVMITDDQADIVSGQYWGGNQALKQSLLAQSRGARGGLLLIFAGTVLQGIGTALPYAGAL